MKQSQNKNYRLDGKTTLVLIIAAGVLLVGALVWRILLEKNGIATKISHQLAEKGCEISAESLVQYGYSEAASIRAIMENIDLDRAVAASKKVGFPSNPDKKGEVYLLLAELDGGAVLTVFVVDENVELAFIQIPQSDEVFAVNEQKAAIESLSTPSAEPTGEAPNKNGE